MFFTRLTWHLAPPSTRKWEVHLIRSNVSYLSSIYRSHPQPSPRRFYSFYTIAFSQCSYSNTSTPIRASYLRCQSLANQQARAWMVPKPASSNFHFVSWTGSRPLRANPCLKKSRSKLIPFSCDLLWHLSNTCMSCSTLLVRNSTTAFDPAINKRYTCVFFPGNTCLSFCT